jgi:hypothetical protein
VSGPVDRKLYAYVMDPADPARPGKTLWSYRLDIGQRPEQMVRVVVDPPSPDVLRNSIDRPGEALRLMAGTADPADAGRLTIPYALDDRRGEIEVRLQDDDRLAWPSTAAWRRSSSSTATVATRRGTRTPGRRSRPRSRRPAGDAGRPGAVCEPVPGEPRPSGSGGVKRGRFAMAGLSDPSAP